MKLSIAFALLAAVQASIFTEQCMHAVGRLVCPAHPTRATHVWMKLKDVDDGSDDVMDFGYTSEQGNFHLYGCARDPAGVIDPTVTIKHNCTGRPQEVTITVPKSFVGGVWNQSIDLSRVPTDSVYKTAAYTGKLQPMCDELHAHTHTTDRKRRTVGRTHQHASWSSGRRNQQCIHAIGKLNCRPDNQLAKNVFIQLIDDDQQEPVKTDEIIDTTYSTDNGNFHVFGCASDIIGGIDPYLIIKHKCGGGQHVLKIKIPEGSINRVYNATLDLQAPQAQYTIDNLSGRMPSMCDDLHAFTRHS